MADNNAAFRQAKDYIEKGRYNDARSILRGINDPAARNKVVSWLNRIDELDPPFEPNPMNAPVATTPNRKSGGRRTRMEEPVSATHNAITLINEGVLYDIRGGCLTAFFRRTVQESGYIPLLDVTTMGVVRQRVLSHLGAVILALFLQALVALGVYVALQTAELQTQLTAISAGGIASYVIVLVLWLVWRRTGLVVYSHGIKMIVVPMKQKVAEAYVERYRELRFGG
jgi:hypothetical protein